MTIGDLEKWERDAAEKIRGIFQGNAVTVLGRIEDVRMILWQHRHHTWLAMTVGGLTDAAIEAFKKAPKPGQQTIDLKDRESNPQV
jgi:hypothetical protein